MSDAARIAELEDALSKERAYSLLLETTMEWKIEEQVEQKLKEQKQSASMSAISTDVLKSMVEDMEKQILAGVKDAVADGMTDDLKNQITPGEYASYARVKAQTYTDVMSYTEQVSAVVTIPAVHIRVNKNIDPYLLC